MKKMIIIGFVLLGLTFASKAQSQTEPRDCKKEFSAGYAYGFARAVGGSAAIYGFKSPCDVPGLLSNTEKAVSEKTLRDTCQEAYETALKQKESEKK